MSEVKPTLTVYSYDSDTHEYIGAINAHLDKRESEKQGTAIFRMPAHSTTIAPPAAGANEAAVLDVEAEIWSVVDDYRGTTYWLPDGTKHKITELGDTIPTEGTLEPPVIEPTPEEHLLDLKMRMIELHPRLNAAKTLGFANLESKWQADFDLLQAEYNALQGI